MNYYLRPSTWYHEGRYFIRYVIPGFIQRGVLGWAKHDTWSFDKYLSLVIAEGLEHMATKVHGCPGFIFENLGYDFIEPTNQQHEHAMEAWKHWLEDKARWFRWYHDEAIGLTPEMSDEERISCLDFWDKQEKHFNEVVLPDFWKHFGNLWD